MFDEDPIEMVVRAYARRYLVGKKDDRGGRWTDFFHDHCRAVAAGI